jgi:hypothetical protein
MKFNREIHGGLVPVYDGTGGESGKGTKGRLAKDFYATPLKKSLEFAV